MSELALQLENASKNEDVVFVEQEHDRAMQMYAQICDKIRKVVDIKDDLPDDSEEVLEFEASGA